MQTKKTTAVRREKLYFTNFTEDKNIKNMVLILDGKSEKFAHV